MALGRESPECLEGVYRTGRGRETVCEDVGGGWRRGREEEAGLEGKDCHHGSRGGTRDTDGTGLCSCPQERLEGRRRGPCRDGGGAAGLSEEEGPQGEGRQVSQGRRQTVPQTPARAPSSSLTRRCSFHIEFSSSHSPRGPNILSKKALTSSSKAFRCS